MTAQQPTQKIALVLPDLRGGGAEKVNLILAEELSSRGYTIEMVLMRREGELLDEVSSCAHVVDLAALQMRNVPRAFASYLRESKPDVVLANMWPLTSMCVIAAKLARTETRIVVSDHSMLSHSYADKGALHAMALRASLFLTYRMAAARVAVSSGVADDLSKLSGIARNRFQVIFNPISRGFTEEISPAAAERFWGDFSGKRILSVGSFKPVKNHMLLVRACAKIVDSVDARLMLLGDGPLLEDIERVIRSEGVDDKVLLPGFFPDPRPFYASADLFVLSSNHEGFGNVIVEALACGLPVVSTDCPSGPSEILGNGKYGSLVPVGDADALATAIGEALAKPCDKEMLRARAQDFTQAIVADHYLKIIFPEQP